MIKITIEGPQGCGKNILADIIRKQLETNKRLKRIIPKGRSYLCKIYDERLSTKVSSRDKDVYDVVIFTKQKEM